MFYCNYIFLFIKLAYFCVSGVGVEAEVGVEAGVEVEVLIVLSETQHFMIETETDLVFQLNCAESLFLEDAGEVMVVNFFTRTIKLWMIAGIVGTGRGADL